MITKPCMQTLLKTNDCMNLCAYLQITGRPYGLLMAIMSSAEKKTCIQQNHLQGGYFN